MDIIPLLCCYKLASHGSTILGTSASSTNNHVVAVFRSTWHQEHRSMRTVSLTFKGWTFSSSAIDCDRAFPLRSTTSVEVVEKPPTMRRRGRKGRGGASCSCLCFPLPTSVQLKSAYFSRLGMKIRYECIGESCGGRTKIQS